MVLNYCLWLLSLTVISDCCTWLFPLTFVLDCCPKCYPWLFILYSVPQGPDPVRLPLALPAQQHGVSDHGVLYRHRLLCPCRPDTSQLPCLPRHRPVQLQDQVWHWQVPVWDLHAGLWFRCGEGRQISQCCSHQVRDIAVESFLPGTNVCGLSKFCRFVWK